MCRTDFRHRFADFAGCAPEEFESKVFWRTLYLHAIPIAWIIRWLSPRFFRLDLETIERVGLTLDGREYGHDLDRYRFLSHGAHSVLRNLFRIRVSGKKLMRLRRTVEQHLAMQDETGALHLQPAR